MLGNVRVLNTSEISKHNCISGTSLENSLHNLVGLRVLFGGLFYESITCLITCLNNIEFLK